MSTLDTRFWPFSIKNVRFWPFSTKNEHFAWFRKFVVENKIQIWFWWSRKWRTGARRRNMFHIGDILKNIQVHERFEVPRSRLSSIFVLNGWILSFFFWGLKIETNLPRWIKILVTKFLYWWHFCDLDVRFFCWNIEDFSGENTQICHQILNLSPIYFVSNIRQKPSLTRDSRILTFTFITVDIKCCYEAK